MIDAGLMAGGKPGVWELTDAGSRGRLLTHLG